MAESIGLIWRTTVIATVTAGLKCAPLITPIVWMRKNSARTWTRPMTAKSSKLVPVIGAAAPCAGTSGAPGANSTTAAQTAKTSAKVPMNSET
jgi:hypothetical protein